MWGNNKHALTHTRTHIIHNIQIGCESEVWTQRRYTQSCSTRMIWLIRMNSQQLIQFLLNNRCVWTDLCIAADQQAAHRTKFVFDETTWSGWNNSYEHWNFGDRQFLFCFSPIVSDEFICLIKIDILNTEMKKKINELKRTEKKTHTHTRGRFW